MDKDSNFNDKVISKYDAANMMGCSISTFKRRYSPLLQKRSLGKEKLYFERDVSKLFEQTIKGNSQAYATAKFLTGNAVAIF